MQTRSGFTLLGAVISLLVGCGAAEDSSERPEPPAVEETAFGEMVGTMDKARSVEGAVLQQKEDIDRAIQDSEGR
jgi:hypothetical protein